MNRSIARRVLLAAALSLVVPTDRAPAQTAAAPKTPAPTLIAFEYVNDFKAYTMDLLVRTDGTYEVGRTGHQVREGTPVRVVVKKDRLDAAAVVDLLARVSDCDFFQLGESYSFGPGTDGPRITVDVRLGKKAKSVRIEPIGPRRDTPPTLDELVASLTRLFPW